MKDTGEIQKVVMKDDTAKGKVILNKTDKSSGEPLKGVEFEFRDSKGKVLETLKTDAAGHAESKLYEIAAFKNGKYDTAIKYVPQSHEETKVSDAPKTGDNTNIWLPILLLLISTGGMAGLYISRKKIRKQ